jgi:hypothetical protein
MAKACRACPYCGSTKTIRFKEGWDMSIVFGEPTELAEWRCDSAECDGRSFWLD